MINSSKARIIVKVMKDIIEKRHSVRLRREEITFFQGILKAKKETALHGVCKPGISDLPRLTTLFKSVNFQAAFTGYRKRDKILM